MNRVWTISTLDDSSKPARQTGTKSCNGRTVGPSPRPVENKVIVASGHEQFDTPVHPTSSPPPAVQADRVAQIGVSYAT
ncbi:MAG TPA: hypothetical protein VK425_06490 [Acidimicrobiales bacterium]|nr:hypothetical protein [Acidimicrobiales bacterium]